VRRLGDDPHNLEIINRLECKISINTYRMFFVENSEDFFHRRVSSSTPDKLQKAQKAKKARFTKFLEGDKGWKRDKTQNHEELAQQTMTLFLGEKTQQIEVTDASGATFCKYVTSVPRASPQPSSATPSPTKPKKGAAN